MAEVEKKVHENVAGKFYVDSNCIDCELCQTIAPEHFVRQDDNGYSYVYQQPNTEEEEQHCREAMAGCPVEAIGEDGILLEKPETLVENKVLR